MQGHLIVWKELQNLVFDPDWANFDIHCQDGVLQIPTLIFQLLVTLSDFGLEELIGSDIETRCLFLPDVSAGSLLSALRLMFQCQDSNVLVAESHASALFWLSWPKTQSHLVQPHYWITEIINDLVMEMLPQRETQECNICGKTLYDKHSLKKHVDAVHFNIKRFQCQVCQRRFSVKNDLKNHVIAVHERAKNHTCDICGVGVGNRNNLRIHKLTHEPKSRTIRCIHCEKQFRHMSTYRKHISRVHEFLPEKRLKCDHCGKWYNHEEGLKRHVKKFHSQNDHIFQCDQCASSFAFRYELNRHIRKRHHTMATSTSDSSSLPIPLFLPSEPVPLSLLTSHNILPN
ncbi:hypothetical protein TCAL_12610 [Tigriopus californicus]|uniref:C2H2-type domain-containing protein n=1 Tax=Tigriopus californicus TaxID=6832 RepID=A0A553P1C9_TIGCA|nr:hypothetical protein TCAL_12610 [Tigriopus californicus]